MKRRLLFLLSLGLLLNLASCDLGDDDDAADDDDAGDDDDDAADDDDDPWDPLRAAIDESELEHVTVLMGTSGGTVFVHSKGDSSPSRVYPLASASKWLSSVTLLTLMEDEVLTLDEGFQTHLPWWATGTDDPRSEVTLEQLLSFTSGLSGDINGVPCVEDSETTLDDCAQVIHDELFSFDPGTAFFYGPSHLQVAGAAASAATGDRFNRVWRNQVADPLGLPSTAAYALPSLANPRIAGGATGSGEDYAAVLTALAAGELLTQPTIELMVTDHTPDGVVLEEVPAAATDGRSWHYALGCWRECNGDTYRPECDQLGVISSPGAFGFYPWWDRARGFWGVVATQTLGGGAEVTVPLGQQWAELAAVALGG